MSMRLYCIVENIFLFCNEKTTSHQKLLCLSFFFLPINKEFERLIEFLATEAGVCIMSLRQGMYIHCKRLMSLATKHYQQCQTGSAEVSENKGDRRSGPNDSSV